MTKGLFLGITLAIIISLAVACSQEQKQTSNSNVPIKKIEDKKINNQTNIAKPNISTSSEANQAISQEVKELLLKSKTKISSVYYTYRGPETTIKGDNYYEFYVKGNKVKYKPAFETKVFDQKDSFDSIFFDTAAKTAESYCSAAFCTYKGKKADLNYGQSYILSVLDWIDYITRAKKVGEEIIDDRSTWKIDTDVGMIWIDTFYGVPLKIESGGKTYRFQSISVNSVTDSDVMAS
ncbi:MAG: hypothetical protein AABX33_03480 [Nanoarchaeota archaeon]|mgnify:CR=1 FL=1